MRLSASSDSGIFEDLISHFLASSGSVCSNARPSALWALMSSYSALFLSCASAALSPALAFSAVCSGVFCFGGGATLTGDFDAGFGGSFTVLSTRLASSSVRARAFSCS